MMTGLVKTGVKAVGSVFGALGLGGKKGGGAPVATPAAMPVTDRAAHSAEQAATREQAMRQKSAASGVTLSDNAQNFLTPIQRQPKRRNVSRDLFGE